MDTASPQGHERRAPFGDALLTRLGRASGTIAFDDLVQNAGPLARYSDVVGWLSSCQKAGLIEDAGYATGADGRPTGPRRWRATSRGREVIARDRRHATSASQAG